jgi:hypothetical protein
MSRTSRPTTKAAPESRTTSPIQKESIPCPECLAAKSLVIDSRITEEGIRRRRLCPNAHRYTTLETVVKERRR